MIARWVGALCGLVVPVLAGWLQACLLGVSTEGRAAALCRHARRHARTIGPRRGHSQSVAGAAGASDDALTNAAARTTATTTVASGSGRVKPPVKPPVKHRRLGAAGGHATSTPSEADERVSLEAAIRVEARASTSASVASTSLCVALLAAPLVAPLGLLGRVLLALGGFQVAAKTLTARWGFVPAPIVECGFAREYMTWYVEPAVAQREERARRPEGEETPPRNGASSEIFSGQQPSAISRIEEEEGEKYDKLVADGREMKEARVTRRRRTHVPAAVRTSKADAGADRDERRKTAPAHNRVASVFPSSDSDRLEPAVYKYASNATSAPSERLVGAWRRTVVALVFVRHATPKLAACAVFAAYAATASDPDGHDFTRPTGVSLVDTYVMAWYLYMGFEGAMETVSAAQVLVTGVLPAQMFFEPMTRSRSLREFWSKRWNYAAQSTLKRLVYDPCRAAGWTKINAAAATYAMSAVLHEYVCAVAFFGSRRPRAVLMVGRHALYFLLQFIAVSVEHTVEESVWPGLKRVHRFVRLALVVAWLSVTTTLFVDVLRGMELFDELWDLTTAGGGLADALTLTYYDTLDTFFGPSP